MKAVVAAALPAANHGVAMREGPVVERSGPVHGRPAEGGIAPCPGCGVMAAPAEGPTHPYMLSSPGCWDAYGRVLGGPSGQLAVDTYAVQHPGVPERRAVQSVCVHLVSLCAFFERDWPVERAPDLVRRAVERRLDWRWPDPALPIGTVTVADVAAVEEPAARLRAVRRWAEDLWAAYEPSHDAVRAWLDATLRD